MRHDVTLALNPGMIGTPQLREARLVGRTLTLSASEDTAAGRRTHRLVWQRAAKRAAGLRR